MENPTSLLVVNDLGISKAFYVNLLDHQVLEDFHDSVKLKCGPHIILMFQGALQAVDYAHGFDANSSLIFAVADLDVKMQQLKSKGVVFIHERPNQNRWGRYAAFKDPSGIVHELMEYS